MQSGAKQGMKCNRVAQSLLDIGDQAETSAQLFKEKQLGYFTENDHKDQWQNVSEREE